MAISIAARGCNVAQFRLLSTVVVTRTPDSVPTAVSPPLRPVPDPARKEVVATQTPTPLPRPRDKNVDLPMSERRLRAVLGARPRAKTHQPSCLSSSSPAQAKVISSHTSPTVPASSPSASSSSPHFSKSPKDASTVSQFSRNPVMRTDSEGNDAQVRAGIAVLQTCARIGELERAEAWLLTLLDVALLPPIPRLFNAVLLACARVADVKRGECWLREMMTRNVEPNVFSFNTLLNACAEAGDVVAAQKWFRRMADVGIPQDAATFRTMMGACARAGNAALAAAWLDKMRAASHSPDVLGYSTLVHAFATSGDAEGAEHWLQVMQSEGLVADRVAFDVIIRAWAGSPTTSVAIDTILPPPPPSVSRLAQPSRAEAWLWKAMEAGLAPTDASILAVADAYVRIGDEHGARRVLTARSELGRPPSPAACALLAQPYASAGDVAEVEALIDELRCSRIRPDAACLRTLLAACARAPKRPHRERAETCFQELCALGKGVATETATLEDLSLAVGRRRRDELCVIFLGTDSDAASTATAHEWKPQWATHKQHRGRVVGRIMEIAPCGNDSSASVVDGPVSSEAMASIAS
eukprot:TRINITY_DN30553_c0_g1_i1.p1 TRINITY_DN30553_c0_g1~~TRINITY_DN30553_c0_g1_i1.p1  ORF type:complete len:584 (-),score=73.90 TRINITY_DN30553_c0_g1_i1:115-1866(-)